ncbi:MAG: DUF4173 domain-containing protein [Oscillospiraceae bacterium]|nr:DUF4173 domain-containing protein [Oscillospiraceae bacterium]
MDMENKQSEGLTLSGGISAPFFASRREIAAALFMYVLAYLYVLAVLDGAERWQLWFALFTVGFMLLGLWLLRPAHPAGESWIWLGCLLIVSGRLLFPREHSVWDDGQTTLFAHGFAVWWVLSRGGTLLEGETSHLLPLDALDGLVLFPFKHFFLRVRCLWYGLHDRLHRRGARTETLLWSLAALAAALGLLLLATSLLMRADAGFADMLGALRGLFSWRLDAVFFIRLLFSLPVGAWLFGLIAGSAREDQMTLRQRGADFNAKLALLHKVPSTLWTGLTVLFSLVYLLFFFVQGRYLFGAFTRTLPEGFIVSQYARQGFFELCRVMAVNFALLWLVTRSSRGENRRAVRLACTVLIAETLLFAVVAGSKLWLYISCFGFTPLRLQSAWAVACFAAGCTAALVTLYTGKKTFRVWCVFCAVTLTALHLI